MIRERAIAVISSFNRTSLELKPATHAKRWRGLDCLLIAPVWN